MTIQERALTVSNDVILSHIYLIRGQKVILDRDLASLYQVSTGNLNKAVQRNLKRFPDDFMFRLSEVEFKNLIFQNGTSSWGGTRKAPYAFTEQGVAMLSGILNSDRAIQVNIRIMRVFTQIRKAYIDNTELQLAIEKLKKKTENNTKNIELVFQYPDELLQSKKSPQPRRRIGYKLPAKRK